MKVLVTGGKGFIGSHLVRVLSKNHDVIIFDIKNDSKQDIKLLDNLLGNLKNVDVIVHLAALCIADESVKKPWEYLLTNVLGTINVLEAARRLKIKKVINASSASVGFTTPYGISKMYGEQLCDLFSKLYNLNIVSLRMFNVYGEGNDKGVIRKFLIKIKNDMPLTVHGDGEYVRDYIYVEDVVSTIKDFVEKNHKSGVYEVGTGIGTSVNELIGTIEKITDKKLEIINEPCPYDIIKDSVSKKSVVKNTIKLEVGLTKVWNSIMKGEND